MALVRLRVLAADGGPIGPGRAFVRLVGLLLSIAIVFVGFLPARSAARRKALEELGAKP